MLKVEVYISQLLYDFNCVILPGLGGFVCNWNSAHINKVSHTFSPPFKNIIFNKNLLSNDGLLVGKIAEELNITYSEANKLLSDYVEELKLKLNIYKRIDLENIGVIYLDDEQNIQFIQSKNINYLKDSFGLAQFKVKSITSEKPTVEVISKPEFAERKVLVEKIETSYNSKKRFKRLAYIAVPVLLLAISIPFGIQKTNKNRNMANLFSFLDSGDQFTTNNPTIDKIATPILKSSNANVETLDLKIDSLNKARIALAADTTNVSTVSAQLINHTSIENYYIVAGCFANKENAVKLVLDLKQKGYDAQIIDEVGGLTRVSYNSYVNKGEALAALNNMKSDRTGVWILKK